ncbi:glycosyltransferase family 2 protein [Brachyspira innocens]|uniref:glycosyltransferase family 2 protein n=1 Tax=Brachyspira innocens TaxID=13264 RepID=UPI0026F27E9F|nr:glycosyltransferase family 2 protein [Brachyspira innocens]MDO6994846.1 glycosyltransferase family 2 protein [Brachyspira innocens]
MNISIIIPCYNEEEVLNTFYERIDNVSKKLLNYECEFIFVNDGSKDKTEQIIEELNKKDSRVKLFSFSRNFGHQAAVSCGIHNSKGDIAVIIDADLQDPPEIIPDMIKEYEKTKTPIIYGKRVSRSGESIFKKLTASLFYRLINLLSEVKFPVDTGDFRLIDKNVIEAYKSFSENPKYIRGLISWTGFEQKAFEYERDARAAGHTKYTFKKMLRLALTGILSFSVKPLRISLFLGILAIFVALAFSIRVFYLYLFNPEVLVKGWASIIITILFMGGFQLISLSIISEYLANIFNEIKKRPEYIVKKTIE